MLPFIHYIKHLLLITFNVNNNKKKVTIYDITVFMIITHSLALLNLYYYFL